MNLDKTELLFLPGKCSPTHDLTITFDNLMVAPTQTAGNLGVSLDSQLSLTANITAITCSCRFMLHNIRRIRLLLTQKAAQVLVQALVISHLDYCNSLLAGLPAGVIRPLQLIQNAAGRLVFNLSSLTLLGSSTPFTGYQWLPASISKHKYLCTVLRTDRVQSTSRTWSNVTPQPVHSAVHLPISLLLPHCELSTL